MANITDVCTYSPAPRSAPTPLARALSEHGRPAQIQVALGTNGRRLPTVNAATLRRYYRYLSQNLSLPCPAWYPEPTLLEEDGDYPCTVLELIDPANGPGDEFDGIFCKVRKGTWERSLPLIELELPPDGPNYQLVEDYWDWFWHWR